MGVSFNGNVTINGNVEVYENGSVKIIGGQLNVPISDLSRFIEENLKYSPNKKDYMEASKQIQESQDKSIIKLALNKIGEMTKELGKNILISGISQTVLNAIK